MKKVLMISYQFPPDTGSVQRIKKYVEYLPDYGWEPVVITHKTGQFQELDLKQLESFRENIEVIRTGSPDSRLRSLRKRLTPERGSGAVSQDSDPVVGSCSSGTTKTNFRRCLKFVYKAVFNLFVWPDSYIWWFPYALTASLAKVRQDEIEVIYTVAPPHSQLLVGLILKKMTNLPWVVDFRDPWANDPDISMPTILHRKAHQWAERLVLKYADVVITTTDFHSAYMRSQLPSAMGGKVHTLTNGYDPDDMIGVQPYKDGAFTVAYAGGFYATRTPDTFLKGLRLLLERHGELAGHIRVELIGNENPLVKAEVVRLGLSEVVFFSGYLDHRKTMDKLSGSTVLLMVVHNDLLIAQTSIPAKLFEYMALGRPVLAITPPGASADLINETASGVIVGVDDVDGVADAIFSFYQEHTAGNLSGRSCPEAMLDRFNRRKLTEELSFIFSELIADSGTI